MKYCHHMSISEILTFKRRRFHLGPFYEIKSSGYSALTAWYEQMVFRFVWFPACTRSLLFTRRLVTPQGLTVSCQCQWFFSHVMGWPIAPSQCQYYKSLNNVIYVRCGGLKWTFWSHYFQHWVENLSLMPRVRYYTLRKEDARRFNCICQVTTLLEHRQVLSRPADVYFSVGL
jgi:hypothetical protein